MAFTQLSVKICVLLLSLVVSASSYGYAPKPELEKPKTIQYTPKPAMEKPTADYAPNPELEKPKSIQYVPKPEVEKPTTDYTPKPELQKPETIPNASKPEVEKPTNFSPTSELENPKITPYYPTTKLQKPTTGYAPKPEIEIPNTISYVPKPIAEKPTTGYPPKPNGHAPHASNPEVGKPSTGSTPKPELMKPEISPYGYVTSPMPELVKHETPFITSIQGMIYCKSGPKLLPIEGALARITCLAVDSNGYESAPFSFLSCPTNSKGYFYATVPQSAKKITACKAFLEKSPLGTCNFATDVNKGTSGAPLPSLYHIFQAKNIKLYSVGPFFYTTEQKSVSHGY